MPKTTFINIDLELRSRSGLPALLKAFGRQIYILNKQRGYASLEVTFGPATIEQVIQRYYKLFRKLSIKERKIWNRCQARVFNIGIEAGMRKEQPVAEFLLPSKSLTLLNKMKGSVVITVYGADKN